MKKIMMFILALIFIFNAKDVFAQQEYQLSLEKQDGIFMSRQGVSYGHDSHPFYIYKMNGMFAYCIEPGKHISTYTYVGTSDYVDLGFSEELKEKLELIGYYGRDYPGHGNVRYSMAAQALIWELTGVDKVSFWTKLNEEGEEIDISKERNEIMNLVNNHKTLPNIKSSYTGSLKKELIINDTNKVLNNYEIETKGEEVYIKDNSLHIIPKSIGTFDIELKRKNYDEYNTIIFVGKGDNSSQKLGRLHFNKEIKTKVTIKVNGVSLVVQKEDENGNNINQANIKFKVKDVINNTYICNNSSCIYSTDATGKFTVLNLNYGEYEIEELEDQIISGYSWNSEKIRLSINENTSFKYSDELGNYLETTFKNNSVVGSLELYKKGEVINSKNNEIVYTENNMINVAFELYTKDNKLVKSFSTGKNGYAKVSNLKVGKYYLKEKYSLSNYINPGKIYFEIKQDNQYQTTVNSIVTVKNILKKGRLEFYKVDAITGKGIPNTIIEIYTGRNDLFLTRETDQDGKVVIDNLAIGQYYIKEKEANYNYELSDEKIIFEIKENNEVVKKTMTNKKILGKLELEKYGEEFNIINNDIKYESKPLANIEFNLFNEKGILLDTLKTDNNGYLSKELELGKYYLEEKTKLPNYKKNNEKYYFEIKKDNKMGTSVKLSINNYLKKGGVEFSKEEPVTFNGISDTLMEIYNENNELLLTRKTNNEGKIIINNLPIGKYYFKEKEANFYYQITDEQVPFEIKNDGEIVNARLTNKKIVGDLEINKKGENYHFISNNVVYEKESLHGIYFDLYDNNDTLIGIIKTDKNGYGKYNNLPLGKYYLIERTKLDKYIDDNNKYYFEIVKDSNNETISVNLEIVNYLKKGSLEFSKTDYITSEGIPDTIIEIYNDKNMLLMTKKTDKNGKVIVNDLPYGKYYIKEKEANYYYAKTNEKLFFEIKDNGTTIKINMKNKKILGSLEIEKNGEEYKIINDEIVYEKNKLANIEFDLFKDNGELIVTLKTNDNGYVKYNDLPLGKYYLVERTKLDNYNENFKKIYFEIKKDDDKAIPIKLCIDNYIKKGNLEFSKTDLTTSEGIPNTVIEIYDENNNLWFTKVTDEFGKVIINDLPFGKYYIIEKEANSLYMITNEKVFFEIKNDGEIVKASMTNEKIEVPVPKTNTKEGLIANIIFTVSFLIGIGGLFYEKKESY